MADLQHTHKVAAAGLSPHRIPFGECHPPLCPQALVMRATEHSHVLQGRAGTRGWGRICHGHAMTSQLPLLAPKHPYHSMAL